MEHTQRAKEVDNASVRWSELFGEKVIFAFILITTVGKLSLYFAMVGYYYTRK